jgi:hypothetical protein
VGNGCGGTPSQCVGADEDSLNIRENIGNNMMQ